MKKVVLGLCFISLPVTWHTYGKLVKNSEKMIGVPQMVYLRSSAFKNNQTIPPIYTCKGEDISPPLIWGKPPEKTKNYTLICDDLDAPGKEPWVHWVVYNLPASTNALEECVDIKTIKGALEGKNDFGNVGYGGPCPPKGHGVHHYIFKLYALDITLDLPEGASKQKVMQAMQGHVVGEGMLTGLFQIK